jgi:hypothetical protein
MARIRTIKIGFFKNEYLAQLEPHDRLCFIGLWLLADKAGRLEDRPLRIKGELFPYETVDMDAVLNTLERSEFLDRYEVEGVRYVQIRHFLKHQRPKSDEPESLIPAMSLAIPRGIVTEPRFSPLGREGKGKEGKGIEGDADAPLAADGADELRALWNGNTTHPITRCRELSSKRRRAAKARLTERPLTEWAEVFTRIQASSFCRGQNDRGWVASFDWAILSPDVAVKVLEGKYDDRKPAAPAPIARALMGVPSAQAEDVADYHRMRQEAIDRQRAEKSKTA